MTRNICAVAHTLTPASALCRSITRQIYEQEGTEESLNDAINALQSLRNEVDIIRAKYWEMRLRAVTQQLDGVVAKGS